MHVHYISLKVSANQTPTVKRTGFSTLSFYPIVELQGKAERARE